jgi:membrane protein YdbS with pleckstrin-like domain
MTLMPAGDRPADAAIVAKYLLPAEDVRIARRRHWAVLAAPVAITGAALLIAMVLDTTLPAAPYVRDIIWIAWALVLSYLIWHLIEWWFDRFIVTDRRIMLVTGIVTRKVAMMPLVKVTDMSYERTVLGRLLGYGEFIMESAGQDQALRRVDFVPQPDWLYNRMCALLFAPEQTGAPLQAPLEPPAGPRFHPGTEPPGPGPAGPDDAPRFGPGYGPDDANVDLDLDTGADEQTSELPRAKPPNSTSVPY